MIQTWARASLTFFRCKARAKRDEKKVDRGRKTPKSQKKLQCASVPDRVIKTREISIMEIFCACDKCKKTV